LRCGAEYAALADDPHVRVRGLLMKLDSDRRPGTDDIAGNMTGNIERLFASLPKPVKELAITEKPSIELEEN
jgi:hypothetical protein